MHHGKMGSRVKRTAVRLTHNPQKIVIRALAARTHCAARELPLLGETSLKHQASCTMEKWVPAFAGMTSVGVRAKPNSELLCCQCRKNQYKHRLFQASFNS
jgi:hypothetical protein